MKAHFKIIIPVLLLLTGCSGKNGRTANIFSAADPGPGSLAPENYVEFVRDETHNLTLSKEIGDFVYTIRYLPAEYMVLKESGNDTISEQEFHTKTTGMNALQYYQFSILNKKFCHELLKFDLSSDSEYAARIEYFSFKMQEDLKLIDGNDTLYCELFHFERTYDFAPYLTFTLAFKNTGSVDEKTFSFNDAIFKNGAVNLSFDKSTFTNLPKIKFI